MYQLKNISKVINDKTILNNINLEFPDTGFVALKGENGAGKSSLLNIIGSLDKPTTGNIIFNNQDLATLKESELLKYREQYISFIFQDDNLFLNSNVSDNINIVGKNRNIDTYLNELNISKLLKEKAKNLSGGEKQKVAILRSLAKDSKIVLADEPTSSLDYETKKLVYQILKEISKERLVIVVSHDGELINQYADMEINMSKGEIVDIIYNSKTTDNNSGTLYHNQFNSRKFTLNNLFVKKRKIIFSSFILILTLLIVILSQSLAQINFIDLHTDTMALEHDNVLIFQTSNYKMDEFSIKYMISQDNLDYLEANKISTNPLEIGRAIEEGNNLRHFEIYYQPYKSSVKLYYALMLSKEYSFFDVSCLDGVIYGHIPTEENELAISSYLAEQIMEYGIKDFRGHPYQPESFEDLVNDKHLIKLGDRAVIISGIYETDFSNYDYLKKEYSKLPQRIENSYNFLNEKIRNIAANIYVTQDFFDYYENTNEVTEGYNYRIDKTMLTTEPQVDNTLGLNEIIVNEEILKTLNLTLEDCINQEITISVVKLYDNSIVSESQRATINAVIKGVSDDGNYYMNKDTLENVIARRTYVNKVMLKEDNKDIIHQIFQKFPIDESEYTIKTNYSFAIEGLNGICNLIVKVFPVVVSIMGLFTILILINYILDSVDIHLKDIAILKSLGVQEKDIWKIFIMEIGILVLSSYGGAILLFLILRVVFNHLASNIVGFKLNMFPINILNIIIILIILMLFLMVVFFLIQRKLKKQVPLAVYKTN